MCNTKSRGITLAREDEVVNAEIANPQDEQFIQNIREKVRERLSRNDLSVEMIASQMLMSERKFYREVKRITHCTPNQLIQAWRLELARELLQDGSVQNLQHLAQRVGYAKSDYFSKLYERRYGESPSAYIDVY